MIRFGRRPVQILFYSGWAAALSVLWSQMLQLRPQGLFAGHPYIWADWSLHLALASNFAFRPFSLWFSSYPVYSGAKLTYPFIADLISGILIRVGMSYPIAFLAPSILCSLILLYVFHQFFTRLLGSSTQAMLSISAILFSGGLGAFLLSAQKGILPVLTDANQVTTQISELGIETNSILPSMLLSQRAFLLGLPVGLIILDVLWRRFRRHDDTVSLVRLGATGILAGLLPIVHTHTFLMIVLFSFFVFSQSWRQLRSWLWYGIPAVFLSTVCYLTFLQGNIHTDTFFSVHVGWLSTGTIIDWVWFWIRNWGVFFLGAIVGTALLFVQRKKYEHLLQFTGFFWGIFILANGIQFQPQLWDNTKLFAWVYIGLAPAFTFAIWNVWHARVSKLMRRSLALCLVIVTLFSGALDVIHCFDFKQKTYQMLTADQIEMGEWARSTPPDSVFLTAETVTNPLAILSGRSVLLGYSGWAFSYGLSYSERQQAIATFYSDPEQSQDILRRYNISYVVVSSDESRLIRSRDVFSTLFTPVFSNDYGTVYAMKGK